MPGPDDFSLVPPGGTVSFCKKEMVGPTVPHTECGLLPSRARGAKYSALGSAFERSAPFGRKDKLGPLRGKKVVRPSPRKREWWGRPFPTRSVGSFVLARGGNHIPRRGISRPRPWRKPRASCAELLFPAWDYAPHPRGTPAVQWFWKDNPPGRLAASSPLYTRGPCMAHPGSFPETKNHPCGVGLNGAGYEARTRFRFPERPAVRPGGPGPSWIQ